MGIRRIKTAFACNGCGKFKGGGISSIGLRSGSKLGALHLNGKR